MFRCRFEPATPFFNHSHRVFSSHELRATRLLIDLSAAETRQNQGLLSGNQVRDSAWSKHAPSICIAAKPPPCIRCPALLIESFRRAQRKLSPSLHASPESRGQYRGRAFVAVQNEILSRACRENHQL